MLAVEALKKYLSTGDNLHLAQAINQAIDYLNNVSCINRERVLFDSG